MSISNCSFTYFIAQSHYSIINTLFNRRYVQNRIILLFQNMGYNIVLKLLRYFNKLIRYSNTNRQKELTDRDAYQTVMEILEFTRSLGFTLYNLQFGDHKTMLAAAGCNCDEISRLASQNFIISRCSTKLKQETLMSEY